MTVHAQDGRAAEYPGRSFDGALLGYTCGLPISADGISDKCCQAGPSQDEVKYRMVGNHSQSVKCQRT